MTPTLICVNLDALWDEFLASLKPWESHTLTKDGTEMVSHDMFVAGEMTLDEVRRMIALDLGDVHKLAEEAES